MDINKTFCLIIFLILGFNTFLYSQSNDSAIIYSKPYSIGAGLKIGNVFQLDYKQFINSEIAFNVSSGFQLLGREGVFTSVTFVYQHDTHIDNLYWYYGGGMAFRNSKFPFELGMAGTLGFEVVTNERPIIFAADIQPTAFYPLRGLNAPFTTLAQDLSYAVFFSFGIKYILKK